MHRTLHLSFMGKKGERNPHVHGNKKNAEYDERDLHVSSAAKFSEAFAKLREVTIRFVMSIRPSARREQLGSRWTDFHKI